MKRAHIVDRFAVENRFEKQILLRVGYGLRVRIGAGVVGENAREPGGRGARQGDADARLDDRVTPLAGPVAGSISTLFSGCAMVSIIRRAASAGNCVSASSVMTYEIGSGRRPVSRTDCSALSDPRRGTRSVLPVFRACVRGRSSSAHSPTRCAAGERAGSRSPRHRGPSGYRRVQFVDAVARGLQQFRIVRGDGSAESMKSGNRL